MIKKGLSRQTGFTLIELLVVLAIIGILITISTFGLQGAREVARDKKRLSDLESFKAVFELHRADCLRYPDATNNGIMPTTIRGYANSGICRTSNIYMDTVPNDPQYPGRYYVYRRPTATTYVLCAALENPPNPPMNVSDCGRNCGSGINCNYIDRGI